MLYQAGLDPAFTIRRYRADLLIDQLPARLEWDDVAYETAGGAAEGNASTQSGDIASVEAERDRELSAGGIARCRNGPLL